MSRTLPSFPDHLEPSRTCPACRRRGLTHFYEATRIPVQSNLLMTTADDAAQCPTGDLRLAACSVCGFITNTAFDFGTQQLTSRYEATQGHSPTFGGFARGLAKTWADRYRLRGKRALEIGCGRGEFIALLCEVGECEGVGIDPIADPEHPLPNTRANVRLIADYYSEQYSSLAVDFVCCRHTLEHIADVAGFVGMIRAALGPHRDVAVCFEVPDTLRVLREGAFWDLYFEHCSYFTAGSLARLFRWAGFEPLDVRKEYDDQYLILESRPSDKPATSVFAIEEDADEILGAVSAFREECRRRMARWQKVADETRARRQRLAIWGSGSKAVGFLSTLGWSADDVPFVVDINPNKHNTYLPGTAQMIVSPQYLKQYRPQRVIAMNPIYREEIARDLKALGVDAELLTL